MRLFALTALLIVGCGPAQAVIDESGDNANTNGNGDEDTDPGNDDPGNDNPGNDDPGNDDPGNDDPVDPDLSQWRGTRTFSFADVYAQGPCEETVEEAGDNVTDDIDYTGAHEACPDCDEIFEVEVTPAVLCAEQTAGQGLPVATPTIRGLEFVTETSVVVHSIRYSSWQGWSSAPLAEGTLSGVQVDYQYDGTVYGAAFTATGKVDFE